MGRTATSSALPSRALERSLGFTLVELIAVVVILAIIAGIALPVFLDLRNSADVTVVRVQGAALRTALNEAHARWLVIGRGIDA